MSNLKDYIENRKFVKWALEPDGQIEAYFAAYISRRPDEKEQLLEARRSLKLLQVRQETIPSARKEAIYSQVFATAQRKTSDRTITLFRRLLSYAAVAILFFALGTLLTNSLKKNHSYHVPESLLVKSAALNTMVYLADGTKKEISDPKMVIDFSRAGLLVTGSDTVQMQSTGDGTVANMVVVPYGKRARLRLPDQSLVELSAGSRIIIPHELSEPARSAYLIGEAFFEITKTPHRPFLLSTTSTEIKVLGTSFGVEAYPDMEQQTTFLKDGKVMLRMTNHTFLNGWTKLDPNEQAIAHISSNEIVVEKGDPARYALWQAGILTIDNESVQDVVSRVERYFNVTIRIPNEQVRTRRLNGKMNLNAELNQVFEYLEEITDGSIKKVNAGEYILE